MDLLTYLSDLDDLTNIIDSLEISPTDTVDTFNADEQVDMIGTIMQLMYDYVLENPEHIQNPSFHNDMMESIEELLRLSIKNDSEHGDIDDIDDIGDIVNHAIELFYMQVMPKRSIDMTESKKQQDNAPRSHRTRQVCNMGKT